MIVSLSMLTAFAMELPAIRPRNLKAAGRNWRFPYMNRGGMAQPPKFYLVLDFEATCEKGKKIEPQEIIEFPCLKVNSSTLKIESTFHRYVKPTTELTPFCTQLTGICQEMLEDEHPFKGVFRDFQNWMLKEEISTNETNSIFVTCGDWDLRMMLPDQCQQLGLHVPPVMQSWINIKKILDTNIWTKCAAFSMATGYFPRGIIDMLSKLDIPLIGRLHSGIDDCYNIHRIMCALNERGFLLHAAEISKPLNAP